jgi:hypothetical protein
MTSVTYRRRSAIPVQRRQQGGYVLGERTLACAWAGSDDRFLTGFARYTWGDGDSTAVTRTA